MNVLFSATHTAPSMQQAARALHDIGLLGAYYTMLGFAEDGRVIRAAQSLDRLFSTKFAAELRRRAITEFPGNLLHTYPRWEVPRTLISRSNLNDRLAEIVLNFSMRSFDRHVARHVDRFSAIYAYNGAALASLAAAKKHGVFSIYGVRDLAPHFFAHVRATEYEKHPALLTPDQQRIDEMSDERASTSLDEWPLADLVVMNSNLCRDTYEASGLDIGKVCVIPLGFPEVSRSESPKPDPSSQLRVLWAGTFTAMKGSHYLLGALKTIPPAMRIRVDVFGKQMLPHTMLFETNHAIRFQPSIPRSALFEEYRQADVLVLPTLSDTFGMVISEAMSQGLPVITTDRAGASQFIRSGENGLLIPSGDEAALADALSWCATHREELWAMRGKARETAASWQWRDFRAALGSAVSAALQTDRELRRPRCVF